MSAKVLVVDDNIINLNIMTKVLENVGYTVCSTSDGSLVSNYVYRENPDIILLDIMMPGLDGFEICKVLKNDFNTKDIPIIMITAKTDSADLKKALEIGAFDYIKKPADEIEVTARVQSALRFKRQQDKLKEMAIRDGLTGIYTHAFLVELLENETIKHQRVGHNISFVMMDIDHFKKINDTYGHLAGDQVLKEVADVIIKSVRESDTLGRYGGEEFGIVLPDISSKNACRLCERIRKNIEKHNFRIGGKNISVTVSIGICFVRSEDKVSSNGIIINADKALYSCKMNGRNKVEIVSFQNTNNDFSN